MSVHVIGPAAEIPPGGRRLVDVAGRSIGVFNVRGRYYALRNACPHQGAPLCVGEVCGTAAPSPPGEYRWEREGEILRCPWHGWEFDLLTGRSVFNPHGTRVRSYKVTVAGSTTQDRERVETFPVSVEDGILLLHV
jgi:nitrite reductase/ring-hydroxylating ferredoxin subunit